MNVVGGYWHPTLGFKVIGDFASDDAGEWLEAAYFDLTCKAWEDFGTNAEGKRLMVATTALTPMVTFDAQLERLFDRIVGHDRRWFNQP